MNEQPLVPQQRFTDLNHLALSLHIGSFQSEILSWGFFEAGWWRNYLHTHSFFEVCYAFAGRGLFRINEQEYTVRQGQIFVARPGEVHEIISSEEEPLGIYFWAYTLTQRASCPAQVHGTDSLLSTFLMASQPVSKQPSNIQRTLELLTEEIARKEAGYLQAIDGLLIKLLLDTARAVVDLPSLPEQEEFAARNPEQAIVHIIVQYLRDNAHRAIAIRDLAAQVHLSERHTSRLFQKVMGLSIMEYLTHLRLETAGQLLLDRHLPIKEVAQATGYPNVRHFTTLFRQKTGLTPAQFRKKGGTSFLQTEAERASIS
ncbi:AraC family transcriptional regulator [Ktedonosporobacter rubrisoli]|uniref:AraC family transcriptional regulator n=1 Tax=Ktedonosporobacter rubrisoli TaxID=2509675 RepID=A0A4P6JPG9_KTERU|nr:AraC family transcriptional regulator [Ktedonosporobacter rubrisoli]QBD76972.1 AraC family transcriptional regulator [Ktedonosporobacter rubrisoli]